jgi:hypothetical protein
LGCLADVVNRLEDAMDMTFEFVPMDYVWEGRSSGATYMYVVVHPSYSMYSDDRNGTDRVVLGFEPKDSQIPDEALGFFVVMDELAPGSGTWALESFRNGDIGPLGGSSARAQFGAAWVLLRGDERHFSVDLLFGEMPNAQ